MRSLRSTLQSIDFSSDTPSKGIYFRALLKHVNDRIHSEPPAEDVTCFLENMTRINKYDDLSSKYKDSVFDLEMAAYQTEPTGRHLHRLNDEEKFECNFSHEWRFSTGNMQSQSDVYF